MNKSIWKKIGQYFCLWSFRCGKSWLPAAATIKHLPQCMISLLSRLSSS